MDKTVLYGRDAEKQQQRYDKLLKTFREQERTDAEYLFSSSGRSEILGNHTDHNHGLVMVAAISCDILAAVKKNANGVVKVCSEGYTPVITNIDSLEKSPKEYGSSLALVKGILYKLKEKGFSVGGFTAHTTSNIFKGAGVSSSAAFEVLIAEIINVLYLNEQLSPVEKAVIGQFAENEYFGKPCGLLDQSGIAIGSLTKLDFNIPEKPLITHVNAPKGYTLVITNTGGDHAKLTDHYAQIRVEMSLISEFFGQKFLRDVEYSKFLSAVPDLKKKFSGRAILRAIHFYNENKLVERAECALKEGDNAAFLDCINRSGISSETCLQNCYVPSDVMQPVVLGLEYSRQIIRDGAVRIHGGGFAGSILACVADVELSDYTDKMKAVFGDENVFVAYIREIGTCLVEKF